MKDPAEKKKPEQVSPAVKAETEEILQRLCGIGYDRFLHLTKVIGNATATEKMTVREAAVTFGSILGVAIKKLGMDPIPIVEMVALLLDTPVLGVVRPSGGGKSPGELN